jgi:hypothetical protein
MHALFALHQQYASNFSAAAAAASAALLNPQLGLDYSALRDYLAAGDVRKADDETRALLIKMAGQGAVQRGWVYFTEIPTIPAADLQTVDQLWRAASNNRFGYSVQKEMWVQVRGGMMPGCVVIVQRGAAWLSVLCADAGGACCVRGVGVYCCMR